MQVTIDLPEKKIEKLIRDVMDNFPEASSTSLRCVEWRYGECYFVFEDEDDELYVVDYEELRGGFEILLSISLVGGFHTYGWDPVGFLNPNEWDDWVCDWDATVAGALVQCAIFGDVIYG